MSDRKPYLTFGGLLMGLLVIFATQGCSGGLLTLEGPPSEVTYLLPKFECAQAPTSARCCPASSSGTISSAEGCCRAHGELMDARKAAVKAAHPAYSNEQVLNAVIFPFTPEENSKYIQGCCGSLPEPNKTCCINSQTGGDLSACADVVPGDGAATVAGARCYAAPENMKEIGGKLMILGMTTEGKPTEITVEVGPPEGSDAATLDLAGLGIARIDFNQTKGPEIDVTEATGRAGASALTGTKMLYQALGAPGVAPPTQYKFLAPDIMAMTGANVKTIADPTFGFAALAYNAGGQPVFSTAVDCPTVALGAGRGGGCGCALGQDPKDAAANALLGLILISIPFVFRRRVEKRQIQ